MFTTQIMPHRQLCRPAMLVLACLGFISIEMRLSASTGPTLGLEIRSFVTEGWGLVGDFGRVTLSAPAEVDLIVALESSDPLLVVPSSVTFAAGATYAAFAVTVLDDSEANGSSSISVTARATGFGEVKKALNLRDNEPDHFTVSVGSSGVVVGAELRATVMAFEANGQRAYGVSGVYELEAVGADGPPVPAMIGNASRIGMSSGRWQGNVRILSPGRFLRLRLKGTEAQSGWFHVDEHVLETMQQVVTDLAYHEPTGKIFATVPSSASTYADQLIVIDPSTRSVTQSYATGPEPGSLAMAPNFSYLYMTISNRTALRRFDIGAGSVRAPVAVGVEAADITVPGGVADAVAFTYKNLSGNFEGVRLLQNGSLSYLYPPGPGVSYYQVESSDDQFLVYALQGGFPTQLALLAPGQSIVTRGLISGNLLYRDGVLYSSEGKAVLADSMRTLGTYPNASGLVAVDSELDKVFYQSGISSSRSVISAFDRDTFRRLTVLNVDSVDGAVTKLLTLGTNGLVFSTSGGRIWFLRSERLSPVKYISDLHISARQVTSLPRAGLSTQYELTVTNSSDVTASFLTVTTTLPGFTDFSAAHLESGTYTTTNNTVQWQIPVLPGGESQSIVLSVVHHAGGWNRIEAEVTGYEADSEWANNTTTISTYVELAESAEGAFPINLAAQDVAYDPAMDRLLISVKASQTTVNGLAVLDPASGALVRFVEMPEAAPGKLARAEDGTYLYVSLPEAGKVVRMNLPDLSVDLQFELGSATNSGEVAPFYAWDMVVVPGDAKSLVVSRVNLPRQTMDSHHQGIGLYRDGVLLPKVTPSGGLWDLEFVPGTQILFGMDSANRQANRRRVLHRLEINSEGITLAETFPPIKLWSGTGIKATEEWILLDSGRAVRREPFSVTGIYPGSEEALAVEPDAARGEVFFITGAATERRLNAHDLAGFDLIRSMALPHFTGDLNRFVRYGRSGLALTTSAGELILIRGSFVQPSDTADLELSTALERNEDSSVQVQLRVRNKGPGPADSVILTNQFSAEVEILSIASSLGLATNADGQVRFELDQLPAGEVIEITITAVLAEGLSGSSFGSVRSEGFDPDPGDNSAYQAIGISESMEQRRLDLPVRGLVWSEKHGVLYATIASTSAHWAGAVVRIEPVQGMVHYVSQAGTGAGALILNADESKLFVAVDFGVQAIDLDDQRRLYRIPLTFDGSAYQPGAMAALPELPEGVVITRLSTWEGELLVYDGVVARTNRYSHKPSRLITGKQDGAVFAASNSGPFRQDWSLFRFEISEDGISAPVTSIIFPKSSSPFVDLDGDRFLTGSGHVVDIGLTSARPLFVPKPNGSLVQSESATGRVFFVEPAATGFMLTAYDDRMTVRFAQIDFPAARGEPENFLRWGRDGFALSTSEGELYLVQAPFVQPSAPADLAVTITGPDAIVMEQAPGTFTITVTNAGPNLAAFTAVESRFSTNAIVTATPSDGGEVAVFPGLVRWQIPTLSSGGSAQLQLTLTLTFPLPLTNEVAVVSDAVDPALENNSAQLITQVHPPVGQQVVFMAAHAMVYDPWTMRLYASTGETGSEIISINPQTGLVDAVIPVGAGPTELAVSDRGFLYVSLIGAAQLVKLHLKDYSVEPIDTFPSYLAKHVVGLTSIPGNQELVAIAVTSGVGRPGGQGGIVLLDENGLRPQEAGLGLKPPGRASRSEPVLFTTDWPSGVTRNAITSRGFVRLGFYALLGVADFVEEAGRIFTTHGAVLDARSLTSLRASPRFQRVQADERLGLVYGLNGGSEESPILRTYDWHTGAKVQKRLLQSARGVPSHFIRWGDTGLAFRTPSQIVILDSGIEHLPDVADLNLKGHLEPGIAAVGDPFKIFLSATNQGPGAAREAVLTATIPADASLASTLASQGAVSTLGTTLTWEIGDLELGSAVTLEITVTANQPIADPLQAHIRARTLDEQLGNNRIHLPLRVSVPTEPNSSRAINLSARDGVYSPWTERLYVAIGTPQNPDDRIAQIDPVTGILERFISAVPRPEKLRISEGGKYLYAYSASAMEIYGIDLDGLKSELVAAFARTAVVDDFEVIHSRPGSVVVSWRSNSGESRVEIYDSNTRRKNAATGLTGRVEIELSQDGATLYAASVENGQFHTFAVGQDGLTRLSASSGPFTGKDESIALAGSRFYARSGLVVASGDLSVLGQLGGSASDPVIARIEPDPASELIFTVEERLPSAMNIYDAATLELQGSVIINSASGAPRELIRCSGDRLALLTDTSVVIVRTDLIETADLQLSVTGFPNELVAGQEYTYRLAISNAGPATAKGVRLKQAWPLPVKLKFAEMSSGELESGADGSLWQLGELLPGSEAQAELRFQPENSTERLGVFSSQLNAQTADQHLVNNRAFIEAILRADVNGDGQADESGPVSAYDPHDQFASAIPLDGSTVMLEGETDRASAEPGEPGHGARFATRSVWWVWTAPYSGIALLTDLQVHAGSRAAVYIGDALGTLEQVAHIGRQGGTVQFQATAGQRYRIAVDSLDLLPSGFRYELRLKTLLISAPTTESRFSAGQLISIALENTETDHPLVQASLLVDGNPIAKTDQPPFTLDWRPSERGIFTLSVEATNSVGEARQTLPVQITVGPANDLFARAEVWPGNSISITTVADTWLAGAESGEPAHAGRIATDSLWWRWIPEYSGYANLTIQSTNQLASIAVYSGEDLGDLTPVIGATELSGATTLSFDVAAGSSYAIALDGNGSTEAFNLHLALSTLLIVQPESGEELVTQRPIALTVANGESDHPFEFIEVYAGTNLLGRATEPDWRVLWTSSEAGPFELSARGTNSLGEVRVSPTVSIFLRPINDDFADALELPSISDVPTSAASTTIYATREPGEPVHITRGERSIWFTWVAPYGGDIQFSLNDWQALVVYAGTELGDLKALSEPGRTVIASVEKGQRYYIAVDASAYDSRAVEVSVYPPPLNDNFEDAFTLEGVTGEFSGSNFSSGSEPGEPYATVAERGSIWWRWTAPASGDLLLRTLSKGMTVQTAVYTGSSVADLFPILAPMITSDGGSATGARIRVYEGTTYWLRLSGGKGGKAAYGLISGTFSFEAVADLPSNDLFASRALLTGATNVIHVDNSQASAEPGEITSIQCGPAGRTLWWSFKPEVPGVLTISVESSMMKPLIRLVRVREDQSYEILSSACHQGILWESQPGEELAFSVDAGGSAPGPFTLKTIYHSRPPNDDFANRELVQGAAVVVKADNLSATSQPGEVLMEGAVGKTLWYSWRAPFTARVALSGSSSATRMVVAVFTGDDVGDLVPVAMAPGDPAFLAIEGLDYHLQLDTKNVSGSFRFQLSATRLERPANDNFADAAIIKGGFTRTRASMMDATFEPGEPFHRDDPDQKSVWWRWQAPVPGIARFDNYTGLIRDATIAVYRGPGLHALVPVEKAVNHVGFSVVGGETYHIAIATASDAIGDVSLQLSTIPSSAARLVPGNILREPSFEGTALNFQFWKVSQSIGGWVNEPLGADGTTWVNLPSGGKMWQDIPTLAGRQYEVRFAHQQPSRLSVTWNGEQIGVAQVPEDEHFWHWSTFRATATSSVTRFGFESLSGNVAIDAVSVVWLNQPPVIAEQPTSIAGYPGGAVSFRTMAIGAEPLVYQWYKDGELLANGTNATLQLQAVTAEDAGSYHAVISNSFGTAETRVAHLTIEQADSLIIAAHPESQVLIEGNHFVLATVALGTPPFFYQWMFNGEPLQGATNRNIVFHPVTQQHAGRYSVLVSNLTQSVLSLPAWVRVQVQIGPAMSVGFSNFDPFFDLDAPVFDVDGLTRLDGPDFVGQLYAGSSIEMLRAVGEPKPFETGNLAGYIIPFDTSLPGLLVGQPYFVQFRVWERAVGESYEEARARGGKFGRSNLFPVQIETPITPPIGFEQLESFHLNAGFPQFLTGRLRSFRDPEGVIQLELTGNAGFRYLVEQAESEFAWRPWIVITNDSGVVTFPAPVIEEGTEKFFRSRILD